MIGAIFMKLGRVPTIFMILKGFAMVDVKVMFLDCKGIKCFLKSNRVEKAGVQKYDISIRCEAK